MSVAQSIQTHAILSASGSERWLNCPPSAQLERQFPEETSEYAAEGTFAHELAELHLKYHLGVIKKFAFNKRLKELKSNEYYSQEMEDYIQTYVDIVIEKINEARARTPDTIVFTEQKLDFSTWVPEGFGTGDVVIIADDILEIIDLKYGKGVPVSAVNNSQMRLYGLGAFDKFDVLYGVSSIRMTIVQPRLDEISTEELSAEDLLIWAEAVIKPKAALAIAGKGDFNAGDHCQFCRVRYTCRTRAKASLELAKYEFQEPPTLTHEEIADILARAVSLQAWATDIQEYALEQAEKHGVKFPGWKLVEGRSNRKYIDEGIVTKTLLAAGYAEDIITPRKLLGITALEKTIGKKKFAEFLSNLIVKPPGKPALVPESDKRPEISSTASAVEDFSKN